MARAPAHPAPAPLRRVPKQQRSKEIVDAIVEATRQLLDERGPDALTTNHIADRAGISIGSLYRYFPDKEAVLAAIYDADTRSEAAELAEAEWLAGQSDLGQILIDVIDFQLDRHRRLLERGGSFYREGHQAFSLARTLGADDVTARIRAVLEQHADEVRVADLDQATYLLVIGLSAIVRRTTEDCPGRLANPAFRRELIDMALSYVIGRRSEPGD